jgi:hypothetical protein
MDAEPLSPPSPLAPPPPLARGAAGTPSRRPAARRPRSASTRVPAAALAAAVLVAALTAGPARAAAPPTDVPPAELPLLSKPPAVAKRPAPTHAWTDGATVRALTLDPRLRADFSSGTGVRRAVLREAAGPLKDVSGALQSPVLRDESGRARALPGGVVVTFDGAPGEAAARALLARHGAAAARPLSPGAWLVESPAGLASLELANRLAASGAFASAQPNWWVERTLK